MASCEHLPYCPTVFGIAVRVRWADNPVRRIDENLAGCPQLHIALIVAAYAALGHYLGVFALLWTSPLFAALLAWPVMKVASNCIKPIAI